MEFVMTYGWAILVVLIAVGLLAYFGVLNFKQLDACILPQGLDCIDKPAVRDDNIEIASKNNLAYPINLTGFSVSSAKGAGNLVSEEVNGVIFDPNVGVRVNNNEGFRLKMYFDSITPKGQVRVDFQINYYNLQTGIAHTAQGYVIGEKK